MKKYLVQARVYYEYIVEAESLERAHEIALESEIGTPPWEFVDYICEDDDIQELPE